METQLCRLPFDLGGNHGRNSCNYRKSQKSKVKVMCKLFAYISRVEIRIKECVLRHMAVSCVYNVG